MVRRILLTIDLTESVLDEALATKSDFILSYHPPIFTPLKSLRASHPKERIIVRAIENRIAIFSPHTTYDALFGGITDWLARAVGGGKIRPLKFHHEAKGGFDTKFELDCLEEGSEGVLIGKLSALGCKVSLKILVAGPSLEILCRKSKLSDILEILRNNNGGNDWTATPLSEVPVEGTGDGRLVTLSQAEAITLKTLIDRVKKHLKLEHVRFALAHSNSGNDLDQVLNSTSIRRVAVCAGSGASVLNGVSADVYLTGEMSHHEVLKAVADGTHVILCEHSNTERGFLEDDLKGKLVELLQSDGVEEILVSQRDRDPLRIL